MADELAAKLARRNMINEGDGSIKSIEKKIFNPYTEFPEFSRKEIKGYEATFKKYDTSKDGFLDLQELKYMMEKLGAPQTHVALKAMIAEVDEDSDGQMNFKEFLMIYKKAALGELKSSGLESIASATSVDVSEVGVGGAKNFFQAKEEMANREAKSMEEIKAEQAENKKKAEEAKARKAAFKARQASFHNG